MEPAFIQEEQTKYITRPIDYTGCHPVIAGNLKKNLATRCRFPRSSKNYDIIWIDAYRAGDEFPYKNDDSSYKEVEPLEKPTTKMYVKEPLALMEHFIADGYEVDRAGEWRGDKNIFVPEMWAYCGKEYDPSCKWDFEPEWLEEKEV